MRRITIEEARERFGSLIDELKLDTPFGEEDGSFLLVQDGKPVGMVIGREGLLQIMDQQREWMQAAIAEGLADLENGRYVELETDEELDAFFENIIDEAEAELAAEEGPADAAAEDRLSRRRTA